MKEEEIKEYLKRVDELETKLTGEDKETLQWLIYGYNQCAKLLNETERENKQQKDNWNELKEWVNKYYDYYTNEKDYIGGRLCFIDMKNKMQEIEQGSDSNE